MTSCALTFFNSKLAATKREEILDLAVLAHRIVTTTGPAKAGLPWLKMARFGDARTAKGSLRWDGNMLAISGIEADYDGGRISFDQVVERLRAGGLLALAYTSPSHAPAAPRWRVLAPTATEYPPAQRDPLMARLNGLLGGIAANESWTWSQSYFFGSINRNPSHRVALLEGTPIDLAPWLIAIDKPRPPANSNPTELPGAAAAAITDARIAGKVRALLANVSNAADGGKHFALRSNGRALGGYLDLTGWSAEEAVGQLIEALPKSVKDWEAARKTAAWAVAEGAKQPCDLEDRPWQGRRSA